MQRRNSGELASDVATRAVRNRDAEKSFPLWPRIVGGLALLVFLAIGCGGWAAVARLEGAVTTTGTVKVDQNLKEVQHRDGGTVKTLVARQGDLVEEGQIL